MLDLKNFFVIGLVLLFVSGFAFADTLDINSNVPTTGQIINGGNSFGLDFNAMDGNASLTPAAPPEVTIYWSTTAGSRSNLIVADTNLYDSTGITCQKVSFQTTTNCDYSWSVPTTIPAGTTIYIDYNYTDYNGVAWTTVFESSSGAVIAQPMNSSMCGMVNLIPYALVLGLLISIVLFFFANKQGFSTMEALFASIMSFIAVFFIAIVIYTLIGVVCVV